MRRLLFAGLMLLCSAIVAGCNLTAITAPTPTPFPTARPLTAGEDVPPVTFVTATPFGDPAIPSDATVPEPEVPPPGANAAGWAIDNVLLPAWNFVYTLGVQALGSLWIFAGDRGGVVAQVLCCLVPAALAVAAAARYIIWGRRG